MITDPRRHADVLPSLAVRSRGGRRPRVVPSARGAGHRADPADPQQGLACRGATRPGADRHDGRPARPGLCHRLGGPGREAEGGSGAGSQQGHGRGRPARSGHARSRPPSAIQASRKRSRRYLPRRPAQARHPSRTSPSTKTSTRLGCRPSLVRALIAEGKLAEAIELARTIPDTIVRAQAFIALVSATTSQSHQPRSRDLAEEAARWAETLPDPYRRARTLAALTEAVAATGDPATLGTWPTAPRPWPQRSARPVCEPTCSPA